MVTIDEEKSSVVGEMSLIRVVVSQVIGGNAIIIYCNCPSSDTDYGNTLHITSSKFLYGGYNISTVTWKFKLTFATGLTIFL